MTLPVVDNSVDPCPRAVDLSTLASRWGWAIKALLVVGGCVSGYITSQVSINSRLAALEKTTAALDSKGTAASHQAKEENAKQMTSLTIEVRELKVEMRMIRELMQMKPATNARFERTSH